MIVHVPLHLARVRARCAMLMLEQRACTQKNTLLRLSDFTSALPGLRFSDLTSSKINKAEDLQALRASWDGVRG